MEEKLKRECKPYLEKLFKKHDDLGSGAVTMDGMRKILAEMIPEFSQDEELNEMMSELASSSKYSVLNPQTKKFEVKYLENSIDFPAALYLCVYFLKKLERRNTDCFSGRSTVRFDDLPGRNLNPVESKNEKRRFF